MDEIYHNGSYIIQQEELSVVTLCQYFNKVSSDSPLNKDKRYAKKRSEKLSSKALFLTSRMDNEIIAVIAYYINDSFCYITHVSVIESHKRKGVFSAMCKVLFDIVKSCGLSTVRLEVNKANDSAISCYKKNGFVIEGVSEKGEWFMEKRFVVK